MAKREKVVSAELGSSAATVDDIAATLIRDINKEMGMRVAYNLAESDAPTTVKRWVDTGSIQLNYAIRNDSGGGYPEGRIIEISGLPSSGKSHLAYHAAAVTQAQGGLVVYIDTECATPVTKLAQMGIDVRKRFVYCDSHMTEEVFSIIESTITKAKQLPASKDIPILIIWDSLASTSPKAELEGDYDQNTVGLQARVVSKGMRKLVGVIGQNNVTLLIINQLREKIGAPPHSDPYVTPGGKSVPFHASVRIRLGSGSPIKDKGGNIIGIHVTVSIKKNKVAMPFRKCEFDIHFGKGIIESDFLFDELRSWCDANKHVETEGKLIKISGTGAWKELTVSDAKTGEILVEKKFYKNEFAGLMKDKTYRPFIDKVIESALVVVGDTDSSDDQDDDSTEDEEFSDD